MSQLGSPEKPNFLMFAVWRLLAALLVMLYHFCEYGPASFADFADKMERLTALLDMFFIVSGFLISVHYADRLKSFAEYKSFLIRRLARLYPLHVLTLSFFCLVWVMVLSGAVSAKMTEFYSLSELLRELLLINAWGVSEKLTFNFVSWSLSAEWFCYLLFPAILFIWRKWGVLALIAALTLYVQGLEYVTDMGWVPFPTWLHANTWGAYRVFADFLTGAIIADLASRRLLNITSHSLAWLALAAAVAYMLTNPSWGYGPVFAVAFACYVSAQVEFNKPANMKYYKPFLPVAAASFGIYLWHPVIAAIMIGVLWNRILAPMGFESFEMIIALAMPVTVIVAMVSMVLFENPIRKLILKWAGQKKPVAQTAKAAPVEVPAE